MKTSAAEKAQRLLSDKRNIFAGAWVQRGRILGYIHDRRWGLEGKQQPVVAETEVRLPLKAAPGGITIEWWDADRGVILQREQRQHEGGEMRFEVPAFRRHLAMKVYRNQ